MDMDTHGVFIGVGAATGTEVARKRERNGQCQKCGRQLFRVRKGLLRKLTPLNIRGKVKDGKCIRCDPDFSKYRASIALNVKLEDIMVHGESTDALEILPELFENDSVPGSESNEEDKESTESEAIKLNLESDLDMPVQENYKADAGNSIGSDAVSFVKKTSSVTFSESKTSFFEDEASETKATANSALYSGDTFATDKEALKDQCRASGSIRASVSTIHSFQTQDSSNSESINVNDINVDECHDIEILSNLLFSHIAEKDKVIPLLRRLINLYTVECNEKILAQGLAFSVCVILHAIELHEDDSYVLSLLWTFLKEASSSSNSARGEIMEGGLIYELPRWSVHHLYLANDDLLCIMMDTIMNCCDSGKNICTALDQNLFKVIMSFFFVDEVSIDAKMKGIQIVAKLCNFSSEVMNDFMSGAGISILQEIMYISEENPKNQIECFTFLKHLANKDDKSQINLVEEGFVTQITTTMNALMDNVKVQESGCEILKKLAYHGHEEIMMLGGIECISKSMIIYSESVEFIRSALSLIHILVRVDASYGDLLSSNICDYDLKEYLKKQASLHPEMRAMVSNILQKI